MRTEDLVKHADFGQDLDPNATEVDSPFDEHPGLEPVGSWAHGLILIGTPRPPEPQASKDAERALAMASTGARTGDYHVRDRKALGCAAQDVSIWVAGAWWPGPAIARRTCRGARR